MARRGVWVGLAAVLLAAGGDARAAGAGAAPVEGTGERDEPPSREGDEAAVAEALGIAARIAGAPTGLSPRAERALATAIVREARAVGLDPLLVAAVIEVESSFRPGAISHQGAIGLMQVMPATGAWLAARFGQPDRGTPEALLEPEWNVSLGVRYLAQLVRRFGRVDEALVAYNAGPTRAREVLATDARERWLAGYPRKVLHLWSRLRRDAPADETEPGS